MTRGHLDLGRPVAVLLVSVLHFVPDEADPAGSSRPYRRATVPAATPRDHTCSDEGRGTRCSRAQNVYNRDRSPNRMRMRSTTEVRGAVR
ncbi:hypothetical protein HBB16_07265 [Pseudonocardia sp. MCCB 268]|nr:hypothetical protein [Pseudonocardia cytotoxica]